MNIRDGSNVDCDDDDDDDDDDITNSKCLFPLNLQFIIVQSVP